jgi:phosphatidylserine decarboxylase
MDFKNLIQLIKDTTPSIHKEGHIFIFIFGAVTIFLMALSETLGFLGVIATLWCIYFFRDPERVVPLGDSLVVSPADGLVSKIEKVELPEELGLEGGKVTRISIFLNVFDVHVNRVPIAGEITALNYHPGQFLSANLDKASKENERQSVVINTENGKQIVCVQIAGLVARRIVCNLEEKQKVNSGERYGIIRFGSRVDVYLPDGVNAQVVEGQRAIGGETILADIKGKIVARKGEVR